VKTRKLKGQYTEAGSNTLRSTNLTTGKKRYRVFGSLSSGLLLAISKIKKQYQLRLLL
jgi:hypothetical protein